MRGLSVIIIIIFLILTSCNRNPPSSSNDPKTHPADGLPLYVCHRVDSSVALDGILSKQAWLNAAWTNDLVNILGTDQPKPDQRTRCKMLWNDRYLYIAAELEESDLWATMTEPGSHLFLESDFEIFLDPNSTGRDYWEIEIGPHNAVWTLRLSKAFRDGGHQVEGAELTNIRTAVHLNGTLNDPSDRDRSWTLEIAIPWSDFKETATVSLPPKPGDEWRIQLARVEQHLDKSTGEYKKLLHEQPDCSAWSPPGEINFHIPESFGHIRFSASP